MARNNNWPTGICNQKTATINMQLHYFGTDYFKQIPGARKHCCTYYCNFYHAEPAPQILSAQFEFTTGKSQAISNIPIMWLTQATTVAGPSLPASFSATTMLDTIGHDSLMNPLSTSRHDAILCGKVPPAKHRPQLFTHNENSVFQLSLVSTLEPHE
jgi:hypothetical protein